MGNELEELFQTLDKELLVKLLDTLIAEQKLDLIEGSEIKEEA